MPSFNYVEKLLLLISLLVAWTALFAVIKKLANCRKRKNPLFYSRDRVPWNAAGHLKGSLDDADCQEVLDYLKQYDPSRNRRLQAELEGTELYKAQKATPVNGFAPYNCMNLYLRLQNEGSRGFGADRYLPYPWQQLPDISGRIYYSNPHTGRKQYGPHPAQMMANEIRKNFQNLDSVQKAVENVRKSLQDHHPSYNITVVESVMSKVLFSHIKYSSEVIKKRRWRDVGFHRDVKLTAKKRTKNGNTYYSDMLIAMHLDQDCKGGDLIILKERALDDYRMVDLSPVSEIRTKLRSSQYREFKLEDGDIIFHPIDMIHGVTRVEPARDGNLRREKVAWHTRFSFTEKMKT